MIALSDVVTDLDGSIWVGWQYESDRQPHWLQLKIGRSE